MSMTKKLLLASAMAVSVFAAGCGGGGSGGSDNNGNGGDGNGTVQPDFKVAGPLDVVQTPLSETVLTQLSGALAGTPLQGVITSVDRIVVQDLLNIVDALALGLQKAASEKNPAALASATEDVRGSVVQLARDLQGLLGSLAAGTGGNTTPGASNPLAGTPLAPLGNALSPILGQVISQVGSAQGKDLNLTQLAQVVAQINQQLQSGLQQIPAQASTAPVLGGVFTTLGTSLNDVTALLQAAGSYSGPATTMALQTTVGNLLDNVLTRIVPLEFAEGASGQNGTLTTPVRTGIAQLTAALGNLGVVTTPVLEGLLGGALSPLLNPIENGVLPLVLNPIIDALRGGIGGGGAGDLFSGTPLAGLFGTLSGALTNALAPLLGPLDPILNPICSLPLVGALLPICRR